MAFQPIWKNKLNEVINNDNPSHVLIAQDLNGDGAKCILHFQPIN